MTFDYGARRVELRDLAPATSAAPGYAMCNPHAARLTPPVGWELIDVRARALTLFPISAVTTPDAEDDVA